MTDKRRKFWDLYRPLFLCSSVLRPPLGVLLVMNSNPIVTLFKNRNFVFLWLSQIITQIGSNMLVFVLALHLFSASQSNMAVGLLFLAFGLPSFLFGPPAGVWVDRIGPKKALLIANGGRTLLLIGFYFIKGNLILTYLLTFLFSTLTQLFLPSGGVLLPSIVSGASLLSANSLFSFTFYLSLILGFSVAGVFLKVFGGSIYFFFAVFFLAATYFSSFLPPHLSLRLRLGGLLKSLIPSTLLGTGRYEAGWLKLRVWPRQYWVELWGIKSLFKEVLVGYNFIRQSPLVLRTFIYILAAQVSLGVLVSLAPGFAVKVLQVSLEDSSLLMILPAAAGMVGGAFLLAHGLFRGRANLPYYGLLLIGGILLALYPITFLFPDKILASVALFFLGIGNAMVDIPGQTLIQEKVHDQIRGKVYGLLGSFITAAATFPVLLAAALADLVGVGQVIFIVGCVLVMFTVAFQLAFRRE